MIEFDPFAKGGLYERHERRWQLEEFVAEATLDQIEDGEWLPKFSDKEPKGDYDYRTSMSVPLDYCRDGVQVRIDNLFRTAPKRDYEKSKYKDIIETLVADADDDGTPLDEFVRRALWQYYVSGCDIVTQNTRPPDGIQIKSKADEQQHGIRPFFSRFSPLSRYDWACNGSGNFLWARYCLGQEPQADEMGGDSKEVTVFLTLTAEGWRIHRAEKQEDSDQIIVTTETGTHDFGRPPIIKLYYAESQKQDQPAVPLGLLTRPAVVAKVLMNLKSQADADLLAAVTRWYGTGIKADQVPESFGPAAFVSVANADAKVFVVQGDVQHIREKRKWLMLYIDEILRLLKFRGGMAEINANSGSGLKLAIERTDLDNELRSTAAVMERTETEMIRQAVMLARPGVKISADNAAEELGYSTQYNRDFVLEPVGQMLDNLVKWFTQCGFVADEVSEPGKEMIRQLVNALMREGTAEYDKAMEEIKSATMEGTSEPSDGEEKAGPERQGRQQPNV